MPFNVFPLNFALWLICEWQSYLTQDKKSIRPIVDLRILWSHELVPNNARRKFQHIHTAGKVLRNKQLLGHFQFTTKIKVVVEVVTIDSLLTVIREEFMTKCSFYSHMRFKFMLPIASWQSCLSPPRCNTMNLLAKEAINCVSMKSANEATLWTHKSSEIEFSSSEARLMERLAPHGKAVAQSKRPEFENAK